MPDASPASREIEARRALEHRLGRLADSFVIDWRAHCTSTNSALIEATPADDGFIHVLIADRQSAGRGRRGDRKSVV